MPHVESHSMMKKILPILSAIILMPYAGTAGATMYIPTAVTPGWHVGFQALYLQSNFNVLTATTKSVVNNTSTLADYTTDPVWTLAYKAQIAYFFGDDLDININWLHFDATLSQNIQSTDDLTGKYAVNQFGAGSAHYQNSDTSQIDELDTTIQNQIDTVNWEFGQSHHLTDNLDLRVHMGLQYAHIQQNLTQTAQNQSVDSDYNYNDVQVDTYFDGIGPRVGFDINYHLGYGCSLSGAFAAAQLKGPLQSNSTAHQSNETNTDFGNVIISSVNNTLNVFDYDASASFRFIYPSSYGNAGFDVGYQMTDYDIVSQSGPFVALRFSY